MNSENVDTEPSADAQASLSFFAGDGGWEVGQGILFFWRGGGGVGYTLHKGQHSL